MSLDWYPFFARDFRRDTLHLSLAEDGAYRRLIDEYMLTSAPLPDNDAALTRILGVKIEDWLAVATVVRGFFKAEQGKLTHKRCEQELHAQAMRLHSKRIDAINAAKARWKKHRELKEMLAPALRKQSARNADAMQNDATLQSKITTSSESVAARARDENAPAEQAEAPRPSEKKKPSELTRADLDAIHANRRKTPEVA